MQNNKLLYPADVILNSYKITHLLYNLKNNKSISLGKKFIKTLEKTRKVHEVYIDFQVKATYNDKYV